MTWMTYKCPRCGLTLTTMVTLKYPPTCSNHVAQKPVEMVPVEKKEKPR